MKKYYFVGDLHLHDVNPRSRVDDYSNAILEKLLDIFRQAEENNTEAIFFLGDIFHKPSGLSTRYLNKVISTFQKSPCPCYTIIGNHDIPFNRVEDVDNTSLGILFKSGALKHLDTYNITDNMIIKGYDYGTDISNLEAPENMKLSICLSHSYGCDVPFGDNVKAEYFKWNHPMDNPFDIYILGHDHSSYDVETIFNDSKVFRFGALARLTSASSDTQREVQCLQLDVDPDADIVIWTSNPLYVKYTPAIECFSQASLDKPGVKRDVDFNGSLEDVLAQLDFSVQSSIWDVIDSLDIDESIVQILEQYLKANFIERPKN